MSRRIHVTDQQIIDAANMYPSAAQACAALGIRYSTYKKYATQLGVFRTNEAGKGLKKPRPHLRIKTDEILKGLYPHYQTAGLRKRLLNEGYKEWKCEMCLNNEWLGEPIPLELDHIDGNCYNHLLENLRVLCPNCHAKTDTYRGKNKKSYAGVG